MENQIFAFELVSVYGAYWICFWVGLAFAVVTGVFTGVLGGGHADAPHLGGDVGHDAASGGGHGGAVGGGGHTMPSFPAFSPITIATFSTVFGGAGMIFSRIPATSPVYLSMPLSLICAFGGGYGIYLFISKVFYAQQASSEVVQSKMVGKSATVNISVPAEGMGEIVFIAGTGRQNVQARAADGQPIQAGAEVVVTKIVGGTYYVTRKTESSGAKAPASQ